MCAVSLSIFVYSSWTVPKVCSFLGTWYQPEICNQEKVSYSNKQHWMGLNSCPTNNIRVRNIVCKTYDYAFQQKKTVCNDNYELCNLWYVRLIICDMQTISSRFLVHQVPQRHIASHANEMFAVMSLKCDFNSD